MRWLRLFVAALAVAVLFGPTFYLHAQPKGKADAKAPDREPTAEEKRAAEAVAVSCCGITGGGLIAAAVVVFVGYVAPMTIAFMRGHPNLASIFVVNVFLGWTFVGWVVAMAWSVSTFESKPRVRRFAASSDDDNPFA